MNRSRIFRWFVVAVLFLALVPANASADDAAVGAVGYGVVPLDNDQISMDAERVEIEIGDDQWVTCVFTFTNTGPATEILMGFPEAKPQPFRPPEGPKLYDFRAFVDGGKLPVTFRPQGSGEGEQEYAGWYTFEVPFEAGQTRVVRNTYRGRLTYISDDAYALNYILATGATWKGPIGRIDIFVRWPAGRQVAPETIEARPDGFVRGDRQLHWHFEELEPTSEHNVSVRFYPVLGPDNGGIAAASSGNVQSQWPEADQASAPFADHNAATAWFSSGETVGAWILWSCSGWTFRASSTYGLGLLPGAAGSDFRGYARPKEVLIRLARLKEGIDMPPAVKSDPQTFLQPDPGIEITEHRLLLEDIPQWQFLVLEQPAKVLAFQVVVESVYPGERYDDVAIAEVLFPLFEEDLAAPPDLPKTGEAGFEWGQLMALVLGGAAMLSGGVLLTVLKRRWHEQ